MRNTNLFIYLFIFTCSFSFAQRAVFKKVKIDTISIPIVPVDDFKTLSFKVYFPSNSVNKDTLRKYAGNLNILKTDAERLKSTKHFSVHPTTLTNNNADIQVVVAFDTPKILDKTLAKINNAPSHYIVKHSLPTKVKILDNTGQLLDYWKESAENNIQFGGEQIEYATKKDGVSTFSIRQLHFSEYNKLGEVMVNKKAIMYQLKKVIESLYDKIYFIPKTHTFNISSAKGKNYDYSLLDSALESSLQFIESRNYSKLKSNFPVWQKHIDKVVTYNKKTMITPEIAEGLSHNIVISNYLMNNLDAAEKAIKNTEYPSKYLSKLIDHSIKGQKANALVDIPEKSKRFKALDIKRAIGRKRKNKDIDFLVNKNIYNTFGIDDTGRETPAKPTTFTENIEDALQTMKKADESGIYNYGTSVMNTSIQGAMLMLDNFRFSGIVNKPFPKEICELTELNQILASNMKFTELPADIGNLNQLKKLVLKGSNLESLPDSIGKMSALESLNLSNNKLSSIPESIKNCTNLKSINLKGNNISATEISKIKGFLPKKCKLKV